MDNERLEQQMAFCLEIDKEKFIGRQTYLTGAVRRENDAEHAWHMAIMTILLSEYANEEIDVLRTVTMLLIHDLVEIDAGDTYAYDEEGKKTQRRASLPQPTGSFRYFQRIRERNSARSGKNLKPRTRRNPALQEPWTICSR